MTQCQDYYNLGICLKGFRCQNIHIYTVEPSIRSLSDALLGNLYGVREEVHKLSERFATIETRLETLKTEQNRMVKTQDIESLNQRVKKLSLDILMMKGSIKTQTLTY